MSNLLAFINFVVSLFCTATFLMAVWNLSVVTGRYLTRITIRKRMMRKKNVAVKMGYYIRKLMTGFLIRTALYIGITFGIYAFYYWAEETLGSIENVATLALSGMSLIIISIIVAVITFKATLSEMRSYNRVYNTANEKIEGGLKGWLI